MDGFSHRACFMDTLPSSLVRVGILFSGNGSNMQNLIENLHRQPFLRAPAQPITLNIELCATNNPRAHGIDRCARLKMPCAVQPNERDLIESLARCHLVLLAGYMKILSPLFLERFPTINIHPSFLPHHKGKDAIRRSFESQEGMGVSVHWVDTQVDGGPIILQAPLERLASESLASFTQRVHTLEHQLYPQAILKGLGLLRYE